MMGTEVREGHRQAGCGVGRVVRSKRLSSLESIGLTLQINKVLGGGLPSYLIWDAINKYLVISRE